MGNRVLAGLVLAGVLVLIALVAGMRADVARARSELRAHASRQALRMDELSRAVAGLEARLGAASGARRVEAPAAEAPEDQPAAGSTPAGLVALNRSGRWHEAEQLAERMLAQAAGDLGLSDRAEVELSLAYARLRRGNRAGAERALERFEALSGDLADDHWLRGSHRRLVRELVREKPEAPPSPKDAGGFTWVSSEPRDLGLDPRLVERHQALCESTGADNALVVYRGRIAGEWTRPGFDRQVYAMSSTKSVTSLLVGCLIDDGKLSSLDLPVGDFLPEWKTGVRSRVTLRHLLSHTSGLPKLRDRSVGFESDKNAFVRALEPASPPGESFAYSNEGVQLLSPILDQLAGEPIQDYARWRLFEPLGMNDTRFQLDGKRHAWTYADLSTTPRDLARIGLLMLQDGRWMDRRIVSSSWVRESTRPAQPFRDDCGLLWWIHDDPEGFAALGYLHTDVHVFPSRQLVLVRTQSELKDGAPYPDYRQRVLPLVKELVDP